MRLYHFALSLLLSTNAVYGASLPNADALSIPQAEAANIPRSAPEILKPENSLEKRKGGGGGGGGRGGGGGGSSGKSCIRNHGLGY